MYQIKLSDLNFYVTYMHLSACMQLRSAVAPIILYGTLGSSIDYSM